MAQELKSEHEERLRQLLDTVEGLSESNYDRIIAELDAVLAEKDAEIRRLKRALWLGREWRAWREGQFWFIIDSDKPKDVYHLSCTQRIHRTPNKWMAYWQTVERKCRAKAEEYR